jgi:hypothetical protein
MLPLLLIREIEKDIFQAHIVLIQHRLVFVQHVHDCIFIEQAASLNNGDSVANSLDVFQ